MCLRVLTMLALLASFLSPRLTYRSRRSNVPNDTIKCYGDLGCLVTSKVWYHPEYRPTNPEPASRHTVKTQFILYARDNASKKGFPEGVVLPSNFKYIAQFGFKCERSTKFFIHDFTSNGYAGWIKHMVRQLMSLGDWNIVSVDWESGARPPYAQAVSNARVVALEMVFFLKHLQTNFSLDVRDVHLIGHGLGGHIAGYVGGIITGLGKITAALDPSGPYFHGMPSCIRLDAQDAKIVEVIHTDTVETKGESGQGILDPIGHFNFYPNQGHSQPGCKESTEYPHILKLTGDSLPPGHVLPGCSHRRAVKFIVDALKFPDCKLLGFRCHSKEAFMNGECTTCGQDSVDCIAIDINNKHYPKPEPGVKLFLKTNYSSPFCWYPYNILLQLSPSNSNVSTEIKGSLTVMLEEGNRNINLDFINPWPQKFEQGKAKSFLAYHPEPRMKVIDRCQIKWEGVHKGLFHSIAPNISISNVYVTSLDIYSLRNMSSKLCNCNGKDHNEIQSGHSQVFVNCGSVPTTNLKNISLT